MADDDRVAELVELGLTTYEARAYVALVRRDSYTATQLAREAGVPRQRIYDVVDGLVRRRLARLRPGRVATYVPVDPELGIARLLERRREDLALLERRALALAGQLAPVWADGRGHTDPLDYVEVLRDSRVLTERFCDISRQATSELLCFSQPPYLVSGGSSAVALDETRRLCAAGGTVRTIYTEEAFDEPRMIAEMRRFARAGEQGRVVDELPLKLMIADQTIAMFDMADPVAETGASTSLIIDHPALAGCLSLAFAAIWARATPIADRL